MALFGILYCPELDVWILHSLATPTKRRAIMQADWEKMTEDLQGAFKLAKEFPHQVIEI